MADRLHQRRGLLFACGATLSAILSLTTQILFERGLGEHGFAQWMVVNGLLVCFLTFACFGSSNFVLSEHFSGTLKTKDARIRLVRYFGVTSLIAVIAFWLVYAYAPLAGERTTLDIGLGVLLLVAQIPVALTYAIFQLQDRYILVAFWPLYQNVIRFIVAIASCLIVMTYTGAMAMWLAGLALLIAYAALNYSGVLRPLVQPSLFGRHRAGRDKVDTTGMYGRGARFGMSETIDALDVKVAVPLAALFLSSKEVAAVALGVLFLNAVFFFPYVFVMRFLLPTVHRYGVSNAAKLKRIMNRWNIATVVALVPVAFVFAAFGDRIIGVLASGDYSAQEHMYLALGAAVIPLCLSIQAAARFMIASKADLLLRWRVEALIAFLVVLVGTVDHIDVAAPFVAILLSRAYLSLRLLFHRDS